MNLTLTKHHGLGNDFLVVFHPGIEGDDALGALARRLCDRRRGIGADGLLIAESAAGKAARMYLYNADGSRAEMSGNGIRCFAQAVAMRRGAEAGTDPVLDPQLIETDAGDKLVTLTAGDDPATVEASVDMGSVTDLDAPDGWATLGCHPDRPVAHLSLGNPHSVVGVDEVAVVDLADLGAKVPQVNLEIVEPGPQLDAITMRVHERGAGITEACGTGACASAFAARSWGLVSSSIAEVTVHMDGGSAVVSFDDSRPGEVRLTGPATYVATIAIELT